MRSGSGSASEGRKSAGCIGKTSLAETNATACGPVLNGSAGPVESGVTRQIPLEGCQMEAVKTFAGQCCDDLFLEGCLSGRGGLPWQQCVGPARAEPAAGSGVRPRELQRASHTTTLMLATRRVTTDRSVVTRLMYMLGLPGAASGCSWRVASQLGPAATYFPIQLKNSLFAEERDALTIGRPCRRAMARWMRGQPTLGGACPERSRGIGG